MAVEDAENVLCKKDTKFPRETTLRENFVNLLVGPTIACNSPII